MKTFFDDLLPVIVFGLGTGFIIGVVLFTVIYISFDSL